MNILKTAIIDVDTTIANLEQLKLELSYKLPLPENVSMHLRQAIVCLCNASDDLKEAYRITRK